VEYIKLSDPITTFGAHAVPLSLPEGEATLQVAVKKAGRKWRHREQNK
jgi:hypothetical protein